MASEWAGFRTEVNQVRYKKQREREGGRIIQSELSSRIKTADELRSAAELKCLFENTRRLILNSNLTEM